MKKRFTVMLGMIATALTMLFPTSIYAANIDMNDYVLEKKEAVCSGIGDWDEVEQYTYDSHGNYKTSYTKTAGYEATAKYKNTYKKGKLVKVVASGKYVSSDLDGSSTTSNEKFTILYTYTNSGLIRQEKCLDGKGKLVNTKTYTYKKGLLTKTVQKEVKDDFVSQTTYSYKGTLLTQKVTKNYSKGSFCYKCTVNYSYKKGIITKENTEIRYYENGKCTGKSQKTIAYTYKNGKLTKMKETEDDFVKEYIYQYAENGQLESETYKQNKELISTKKYYTSGKYCGLLKEYSIDAVQRPSTNYKYRYSLSKDKSQLIVKLLPRDRIAQGEELEGTWTYIKKTW